MIFKDLSKSTLVISQKELYELWEQINLIEPLYSYSFSEFEYSFQKIADSNSSELRFSPHGWTIELKEGLVKASVLGVLQTMLFKAFNESNIPLTILVMVVPLLFNLNKISLSEKERTIYLDLTNNPLATVHAHSTNELYDNYLSDDMKSNINRLDFLDFLEKLKQVGLLKKISSEKLVIKNIGKYHFHISIK